MASSKGPRVTQTLSSIRRISIADEKKRQEKVDAEKSKTDRDAKKKSTDLSVTERGLAFRTILQKDKTDHFDENKQLQNKQPDPQGGTGSGNVTKDSKKPTTSSQDQPVAAKQAVKPKKPVTGAQSPLAGAKQADKPKIPASKARLYRDNLDFYQNKIHSKPLPGHKVEDMLKWKGDYGRLERNHSYIQWLFPIPESNGMNLYAQPLMEHEAQEIGNDDKTQARVLRAYKMMLDFYGMQLVDTVHGTVRRSSKGWEDRYYHLNWSRHNFLRITRILKSLGELGYERFQAPWVKFLIEEAVIEQVLPNLNGRCLYHWIDAVKDEGEREALFRKAHGLPINDNITTEEMNSEPEDEEEEKQQQQQQQHGDTASEQLDSGKSSLPPKTTENKLKTEVDENVKTVGKDVSKLKMEDTDTEQELMKGRNHVEGASTTATAAHSEMAADWELPSDNLKFYQNNLNSRPSPGFTIDTMLKSRGQYEFFDEYPCFIQWLFPISEKSERNTEAQQLFNHEAKAIREDNVLSARVLEAYKLVLDLFGMSLQDDVVGKFKRVKKTYKKRYEYLYRYTANYLRITRILKSLGELGFERFQVPWIDFLVTEGIDNAMFLTLDGACIMHWINAISDEGEKQAMFRKYQRLAGHQAVIRQDGAVKEDDMREGAVCNAVYIADDEGLNNPFRLAVDPTLADRNLKSF